LIKILNVKEKTNTHLMKRLGSLIFLIGWGFENNKILK
jgi:hypothetical protein